MFNFILSTIVISYYMTTHIEDVRNKSKVVATCLCSPLIRSPLITVDSLARIRL